MRVIVTGANGFLGRHLVEGLERDFGFDTVGFVRCGHRHSGRPTKETDYGAGLSDLIENLKPGAIVHCAGAADPSKSLLDPEYDFATNTALVHRLLSAIGRSGVRPRLINLSSAAVYGDAASLPISETHADFPISPYGVHKLMGEQVCKHLGRIHSIPNASLRIFSAYGPYLEKQVIWSLMCRMEESDHVLVHGTGRETRDFIYAEDVCRVVAEAIAKAPCEGESYNVANGVETSIASLAAQVGCAMNYKGEIQFDGKVEQGKPVNWRADIGLLLQLGYQPSWTLERGLAATAEWFQGPRKAHHGL